MFSYGLACSCMKMLNLTNTSVAGGLGRDIEVMKYRVIQKDVLNFLRLYFLNYTGYVNDLHNI